MEAILFYTFMFMWGIYVQLVSVYSIARGLKRNIIGIVIFFRRSLT